MYWSLLVVEVVLEVENCVDFLVQVSHLVHWLSFGALPVECKSFGSCLPDDFLSQKADDLDATGPVVAFV